MNIKKIIAANLLLTSFLIPGLSSCQKNTTTSKINFAPTTDKNIPNLDDILLKKDWSQPTLFVGSDTKNRRISLRSWGSQIKFYVGGEFTYISAQDNKIKINPIKTQMLNLKISGGRLIEEASTNASLKIFNPTLKIISNNFQILFNFEIRNQVQEIISSGSITEQAWAREFTIATYNVENLFDQTDSERNWRYGDYRINVNPEGRSSNWGDPIQFEGKITNFTEIKAETIKKVLQAIEPTGPAIVALQEIESEEALEVLFKKMQPLGYTHFQFSHWFENEKAAIGLGIISKYPIVNSKLVKALKPKQTGGKGGHFRPIFRTTILTNAGKEITIYVNHWPSKGKPESFRYAYGVALQNDIESLIQKKPEADYIIVGDLNCEYNENIIIIDRHNDMNGKTGINSVLKAQGNELLVAQGNKGLKYNLQYELSRSLRKTGWYGKFGWSAFDNFIINDNLFDQIGLTYVDNSFTIANKKSTTLSFLFKKDGTPHRWHQDRIDNKYTKHSAGGYSDHLPSFARFYFEVNQSSNSIKLRKPSMPNHDDRAN